MRFLHTADWHLGKYLGSFSRLEEQREVLEEICAIADEEQADLVLIAGDLFDTLNPSAEARHLFYRTLKRLSRDGQRPIVAIAGNHDSAERIEEADPLAFESGIFLIGHPDGRVPEALLEKGLNVLRSDAGFLELQLPAFHYPVRLLLTPYANEVRLKRFLGVEEDGRALRNWLQEHWQTLANHYCDGQGVNLLLAHLFFMEEGGTAPGESEDEKPILFVGGAQAFYPSNVPAAIQYTALGHIHRGQQIGKTPGPICYSGSPLSYSFAEAGQRKNVNIVDALPGESVEIRQRELRSGRPLKRKRFEAVTEALAWLEEHPDALVELTICTDTFLTAAEKQSLLKAHSGIVMIIPEVRNAATADTHQAGAIDLTQNIDDLFAQYFRSAPNGQAPNEELLSLFWEIRSQNQNA